MVCKKHIFSSLFGSENQEHYILVYLGSQNTDEQK